MKKILLLALATVSSGMIGSVMASDVAVAIPAQTGVDVGQKSVKINGMRLLEANSEVTMKPQQFTLGGKSQRGGFTVKTRPTEANGMSISYENPVFFFAGMSVEGYTLTGGNNTTPFKHYPAYVDLKWTNTTTGATSYTWNYITGINQDATSESDLFLEGTSTETDLVHNYEWTMGLEFDSPTLTATNGSGSGSFIDPAFNIFGGGPVVSDYNFGMAMYDSFDAYTLTAGSTTYGIGNTTANQNIAQRYPGYSIAGFGNLYPQPASPYAMSKVWANVTGIWSAGATVYATVYSWTEDGLEEIAYATSTVATASSSHDSSHVIEFDLSREVDGFISTGYITIDTDIYVEISAGEGVTELSPVFFVPSENSDKWCTVGDDGYIDITTGNPMFYHYLTITNGESTSVISPTNFHGFYGYMEGYYCNPGAFVITTDAAFGWLNNPEGLTSVSVPASGGTADEYLLWTLPDFNEDIFVESDLDSDNVIDDAEWLSYDLQLPTVDGDYYYYGSLVFSAEPLPAGEEGRSATVEISVIGAAPLYVTVNQGTTGITAVTTSAAKVSVEGGNFVVTAPEAINAATVYNIAGQAVAASEIAGTTTIDGSSFAKGVYIVRFNDGSSVKVVK